ncbi:nucleolin-like [Sipha flava]|uniref:Nucleolin-like n=2 Tax=Sipha flava TaxID=143950 RepID=A0A8B8GNR1_9HEMI|nr:nucleolin-like [Sipha flava]
MRLSVVFELLLIFLIIAFAAYGRVIPENKDVWNKGLNNVKEHLKAMGRARQATPQAAPPNRYCACSNLMCNCCRDFSLPVVPIKGPGCASLKYLKGDQMAVTMSFGDKVLRNTTISGKKPKPVCMSLPGGISKFCGRVYGISRDGDQFKACLGLELRALDDVEAALRVSCFRFGPQGMKVEPAQPLPASQTLQGEDEDDEEDDDDDDDDDYGLGGGDDEEEDDDDSENDVESTGDADYTGLSALSTDFLDSLFGGGGGGGEDDENEASTTAAAKPTTAKPVAVKSKVTAAPLSSSSQQVTEKQAASSVESVTSTSFTVSVVQDPAMSSEVSADARPTTTAPLDDNPTDRVETVPTSVASKDKDYEDDDDEDDDDDEEEESDLVSDIIETAASAVGMSADGAVDANSTTAKTIDRIATTEHAAAATTSTTIMTVSSAPAAKDYDDDDDDDEDDDDGYRSFKHMPVAIVPNDRRGRTHRRMRLSSADESTIHFMQKV